MLSIGRYSCSRSEVIFPKKKQKEQYGLRNEAWIAVDDARADLSYLRDLKDENDRNENLKDLLKDLENANIAMQAYLAIAPAEDVQEARSMGIDFAKNAFAGSFVGGDFLEDALGTALPEIADATHTFTAQFEGQLKDQLGGLKDVGSKIDTNALQDQLKGQRSQNSI